MTPNHYPYFKCRFCQKKVECCLNALDKRPLCTYNTLWSIWKWSVRSIRWGITNIFRITAVIVGIYLSSWWGNLVWIELPILGFRGAICYPPDLGVLKLLGLMLIPVYYISVIWRIIIHLHEKFMELGGRY